MPDCVNLEEKEARGAAEAAEDSLVDALVANLQQRFKKDHIYVSDGPRFIFLLLS